jgi:hypothetical protein
MCVCCKCCAWSDGDLCDKLITRPEESYRVPVCVCVFERERESGEATIALYTHTEQVESDQAKKKISPFRYSYKLRT